MRALRLGILCLALGAILSPAHAADIKVKRLKQNADVQFISIIGDIEQGDADKLRKIALKADQAVVWLASDGGQTVRPSNSARSSGSGATTHSSQLMGTAPPPAPLSGWPAQRGFSAR